MLNNLPPINHTCCGTPCFWEYQAEEQNQPCWGDIQCVDSYMVEFEDGSDDEYRRGACEGHIEMYPNYDETKYQQYEKEK